MTEAALEKELAALAADPALDALARAFWLPRIIPSLRWAAERVWAERDTRWPVASEVKGAIVVDGIRLHGKADRIDQLVDGSLAIVDYKSGSAPSGTAAAAGLDNQLGLLGLIAAAGQADGLDAAPVGALEYWSLKRDRAKGEEGKVSATHGGRRALKTAEEAVERAAEALADLSARFLLGQEPFVPGEAGRRYADFDQLMRRDEWFGRGDGTTPDDGGTG